jgi:hypothetical protein
MLRPIPDFNSYAATHTGKIFSLARQLIDGRHWRFQQLRPKPDKNGRLSVCLYRMRKQHRMFVHQLILKTFVGPCPIGLECCHNDGNPLNNAVSNLRWDTRSSNARDAVRHGTCPGFKRKGQSQNQGTKNASTKLSETEVRQIIYTMRTGLFSQREVAKQFSVSRASIGNIKRKTTWLHLWPLQPGLAVRRMESK